MEGDFLRLAAKTPLRASYLAAGMDLIIETNVQAFSTLRRTVLTKLGTPTERKKTFVCVCGLMKGTDQTSEGQDRISEGWAILSLRDSMKRTRC